MGAVERLAVSFRSLLLPEFYSSLARRVACRASPREVCLETEKRIKARRNTRLSSERRGRDFYLCGQVQMGRFR